MKKVLIIVLVIGLIAIGVFFMTSKDNIKEYPKEVTSDETITYDIMDNTYYIKYSIVRNGKKETIRYSQNDNEYAIEFLNEDNIKSRIIQRKGKLYTISDEAKIYGEVIQEDGEYKVEDDNLMKKDMLTANCVLDKEEFNGEECTVETFELLKFYYNDKNELVHIKISELNQEIDVIEFSREAAKEMFEIPSTYKKI